MLDKFNWNNVADRGNLRAGFAGRSKLWCAQGKVKGVVSPAGFRLRYRQWAFLGTALEDAGLERLVILSLNAGGRLGKCKKNKGRSCTASSAKEFEIGI